MVESNKERAKNKTLDTIDEEKPSKGGEGKKKKKPVTLDDSSEEEEPKKEEKKSEEASKKEEPVQSNDLLGDLLGMGDAPTQSTPAATSGGNDLIGLDFGSGPPAQNT